MKTPDREPDGSAHALDLVAPAFVQRELDLRRTEATHLRGRGAAVLELDAAGERSKRSRIRIAVELDFVDFDYAVTRVGESVGERSIVRQQERPRGVEVEPADRYDARAVANQVEDRGAPSGVAGRGNDSRRLVKEHVGTALSRHGPPVELDAIARLDERVQLSTAAVHPHAAGFDQLVGSASRGDAGSREERVQAHA